MKPYNVTKEQMFVEALSNLRKRMFLNDTEFAEALGMKYGTYRDRLRDPAMIRLKELVQIENIGKQYGMSLASIWFDKLA